MSDCCVEPAAPRPEGPPAGRPDPLPARRGLLGFGLRGFGLAGFGLGCFFGTLILTELVAFCNLRRAGFFGTRTLTERVASCNLRFLGCFPSISILLAAVRVKRGFCFVGKAAALVAGSSGGRFFPEATTETLVGADRVNRFLAATETLVGAVRVKPCFLAAAATLVGPKSNVFIFAAKRAAPALKSGTILDRVAV